MNNPCENCIIKCNCTKVCTDKIKYGTYLETELFSSYILCSDAVTYSKDVEKHRHFSNLLEIHRQNEVEINNRWIDRKYP